MHLMDFPGPLAYDAQPDVLYHNKGDGTFEDVTQKWASKTLMEEPWV